MIVLECEQGSATWERARLGIPTSSSFDRIVTPKRMQASKSQAGYIAELLAEWALGRPLEQWVSPWAERGTELEPEARRSYAFERGEQVAEVGFVYRDEARMVGCSPDGLVGDDGGLELKCPAAKTHIGYVLDRPSLVDEYRLQIHGGLWVTGRAWWDVMSYYPGLPPVIVRVEADPDINATLEAEMGAFLEDLVAARSRLEALGVESRLPDDPTQVPEWALPSVDVLQGQEADNG